VTVAVATLSPTRALREPRRLNVRALTGLFLALAAFAGSVAFWTVVSDTRPVLVATRDLPAGATLVASDLAVARVRLDEALYAAALPAAAQAELVGRPLAHPLHRDQLLVRAQLSARPPLAAGQVALPISVDAASAAGGRVRPGDVVRVLVTTDKGKPESRTSVVLEGAPVHDVGYEQRAAVVGGEPDRAARGPLSSLTLAVTPEEALRLAHARHNGAIDVALVPAAR
jgi:Flp pilus assembly protein CpaB